jgi:hypothetical protein
MGRHRWVDRALIHLLQCIAFIGRFYNNSVAKPPTIARWGSQRGVAQFILNDWILGSRIPNPSRLTPS